MEKNPQAVIHFAKTKLRKRGYGEDIPTEEVGAKIDKMEVRICDTKEDVEFYKEYDKWAKENKKE